MNTSLSSAAWRRWLKAEDIPRMAACGMLAAAGYASYNVLPILMRILSKAADIPETKIGILASADLAGILVGSLCLSKIMRPGNSRLIGAVTIAAGLSVNLLTPSLHGILVLVFIRFLAGLAGGICISLALAGLARFGNTAFNTAIFSAFTIVGTSVEFLALSYVESTGGGAVGGYLVVVFFFIAAGLTLKWYPEIGVTPEIAKAEPRSLNSAEKTKTPFAILISILLYGIGVGGLYAYIGALGSKQGISDGTLTHLFNVANILTLISSWISFKVADRFGPARPLTISLVLFAIVLGAMPTRDSPITFAVLALAIGQLIILIQNNQIDFLLRYDSSGRTAALFPTAVGIGLAIGPLLGSFLLATFQTYRAQLVMEAICVLIAASIVALIALGRNSRAVALPERVNSRLSCQSTAE